MCECCNVGDDVVLVMGGILNNMIDWMIEGQYKVITENNLVQDYVTVLLGILVEQLQKSAYKQGDSQVREVDECGVRVSKLMV